VADEAVRPAVLTSPEDYLEPISDTAKCQRKRSRAKCQQFPPPWATAIVAPLRRQYNSEETVYQEAPSKDHTTTTRSDGSSVCVCLCM